MYIVNVVFVIEDLNGNLLFFVSESLMVTSFLVIMNMRQSDKILSLLLKAYLKEGLKLGLYNNK